MSRQTFRRIWPLALLALAVGVAPAVADIRTPTPESVGGVNPLCPGDTDGDMVPEPGAPGYDPNAVCMHLAAGDGFANMADGVTLYTFGFSNVTGVLPGDVIAAGTLAAMWPAPTIALKQGQDFYLALTNVGMQMRPDLFDPHTVHYHGFANASAVFDGLPESGIAINMGSTLTYYYYQAEPGTYMYHCHVEATEHMQMGMLGNLYVLPAQNDLPAQTFPSGWSHTPGMTYAYNDGDGSTYYDHDYALQIGAFDRKFHEDHLAVQPLPFSEMRDTYPMINGRGYPDTVLEAPIANGYDGHESQVMDSKIVATEGDKILLRLSNLGVVQAYTIAVDGIPMRVIARDARLLRSRKTDENLYYETSSVTLGGGQSMDVILDLADFAIPAGVYPLYTTNLNYLSNGQEDFGGMMTEIHVLAP
jgi:FtsP/CotA-like multicopper oxidase with cupredoxin domain